MDMTALAQDLHGVLMQACTSIEPIGQPDNESAAWVYVLPNDMACLVGCESNPGDGGVATISLSLSMGDASALTAEELFTLLNRNAELYRATLTAHMVGGSWTLFLQDKVMAEAFRMEKEELLGCMDHLLTQHQMFLA